MKSEHRLNLCFDLENPKHKVVYDYLMAAGRQKTSVAVDLMMRQITSDTRWKSAQEEREARLTEHFEASVKRGCAEIIQTLRDMQQSAPTTQISGQAQKPTAADDSDGMSDDAFAAAMALLNF